MMKTLRRQRGAALMLLAALLVLGAAWLAVGVLGGAAPSLPEREARTGHALQAGKQALLAYVAQYAARTEFDYPGRMPCPEALNAIGTATLDDDGRAATTCANASVSVGRLPWRTLAIDPLRDGDGELLWYALSPGFRGPTPPINFGTPAQLPFSAPGSPANIVAVIIAPGRALNTLADPGTAPSGCTKVNQLVDRYVSPLDPAKFLECGNAVGTGANPYFNPGNSQWSNDRVIAITHEEWADAISGAVADRLQRTVAPVLANWDQIEFNERGKSWGASHNRPYLPFASTFSDPATNDLCGNAPTREGLPPLAASTGACDSKWTGSVPLIFLSSNLQIATPCEQLGTELRCTFLRLASLSAAFGRINVTAARGAGSFRSTIVPSDVIIDGGGTVSFGSMNNAFNLTTGAITIPIDVSWPAAGLLLDLIAEVRIPNLKEAVFMTEPPPTPAPAAYSATKWFRENQWGRYTYYAVAPGSVANASPRCGMPSGVCLTVNGMSEHTSDTRLLLVLMGRSLPSQNPAASPNDINQYLESRVSSTTFDSATVTSTFNDRLSACPFQHTTASGATVTVCD